jgi:tetratricopeptide (TPR) repeat protein
VDPVEGAPDLSLPDPEQAAGEERTARRTRAARWLRDERHTLLACVRLAHDRELDALTVALCETVWTLALDHPRQPGVTEAFRLGRDSAVRSGDVPAMVRMRCQLARRLWESGDNDAAAAEIRGAFAGLELLGEEHTKLRASAVEFRGMLASVTGDWAAAAADFARSRDLHLSIGNAYGALLQTYRLGQAQSELGDQEAALTLLADAHNTATAMERERITARIALALGRVLAAVDRRREAARLCREALESARRRGSGFEEARVLDALAALESAHDPEQAAMYAAAAAAIRERNGVE